LSSNSFGIEAKPAAAVASAGEKNCLACHGPFDKLIAGSTNYVAPSGEKTSPHRYVPHDSKEKADIPDCLKCHTAHAPNPAKGSIDLAKININYCYTTCHHEKTLTSCKQCHP
jgi:hypothetical protein